VYSHPHLSNKNGWADVCTLLVTKQRLCEHQKQMQIMSQQLDGDVNICKPWKQERFRGLGDDAKTLGVVVNVVVATLIN
jgi:hypothetical protein